MKWIWILLKWWIRVILMLLYCSCILWVQTFQNFNFTQLYFGAHMNEWRKLRTTPRMAGFLNLELASLKGTHKFQLFFVYLLEIVFQTYNPKIYFSKLCRLLIKRVWTSKISLMGAAITVIGALLSEIQKCFWDIRDVTTVQHYWSCVRHDIRQCKAYF